MIQFNELRITPDGNNLIIDVSVKDIEYYSNVFIDSIVIDNQDTFKLGGPSSKPIYTHTVEESFLKIYSDTQDNIPIKFEDDYANALLSNYGKVKNVRLVLSTKDFIGNIEDLSSNLFFVYINTKGEPAIDTPCGMDNILTMGIVYNKNMLYTTSMLYLRELESSCIVPKNLIDYILKMKALELSLKTGNYIQSIKYWNRFFKNKLSINPVNCNCQYGRSN